MTPEPMPDADDDDLDYVLDSRGEGEPFMLGPRTIISFGLPAWEAILTGATVRSTATKV